MKIAILHMTMGLSSRGSETVMHELATGLSAGNQVLVLHSGDIGQVYYQNMRIMSLSQAPMSAPVNTFEKIKFRLNLDEQTRLVKKFTLTCFPEIKSYKPDVIVAVNGSSQVKMLKCAFPKIKIVVFGHAGIGYSDAGNLHAKPDLFIALTAKAYRWALKLVRPGTKLVYIPNPIDLSKFAGAKPVSLKLAKPVVLTVGALTSYKNIESVIGAVRRLAVSYVLVGDGERRSEIADEFSTLTNEFSWFKSVEPDSLPSIYRAGDVFCFVPDAQESFGRVYLEAMAAGLPIVASDDPIRREIIGDKGFFVDPHNEVDIASKIVQAIKSKHPDYHDRLKEYDVKKVTKQIEKEMYDLVA